MRALAFTLFLAACTSATDKDTGSAAGDAAAGADVYALNCASCHGSSGEGGTGPAMTDVVGSKSDDQITDVVRNGAGDGAMPAFTDAQIDAQDLADLLAYLRETYGG